MALASEGGGRLGFDPWVRKIPWSRKWQPTPVFLPGKSHGPESMAGYNPWGCKEADMTKHTQKQMGLQTEPPSALGKRSRWKIPTFASTVHCQVERPTGVTCKSFIILSPTNHTEIGLLCGLSKEPPNTKGKVKIPWLRMPFVK